MSAWLCSNRHIRFLAKAAEVHGLIGRGTAEPFAVAMKRENLLSLAARYGDPMPEVIDVTEDGDFDQYAGMVEVPAFVHKQAACFDYQSCEHDGWATSEVGTVIRKLYERTDSPGGLDLTHPWGI